MNEENVKLLSHYLIGMPQLSAVGLSEQWLLKECGHEHWMALAHAFGQIKPEFKDSHGRKVYAAFMCVNLENGKLDQVNENDEIDMITSLIRTSSTRSMSTHLVMRNDQVIARVHMISTFVYRATAGNNQSVVKADMKGLAVTNDPHAQILMSEHKAQRGQSRPSLGEYRYLPCPYTEFNGADFLYFATFQSIADRAERYFMPHNGLWSTISRSIYYYGNVNIDDVVIVKWVGRRVVAGFMINHLRMIRGSDGEIIGDIYTEKESVMHDGLQWRQQDLMEGV